MRPKDYKVSDDVLSKARYFGIYGNTQARLSRMARRSAPCTSPYGNRRYQHYVLLVDGATIKDVTRILSS